MAGALPSRRPHRLLALSRELLFEEIIGVKWRIRRLKTIEVALVDYEMDCKLEEIQQKLSKFDVGIHMAIAFKGLADESRAESLRSRYEARLHRIFHRAHHAFMDLRRDIAAGLIGQPPAPVAPEPPAPARPKIKFKNEPAIQRVLRRIRNHQPLNAAFRRRITPSGSAGKSYRKAS